MLYSHKYFIISLNFQIIKNVLLDFCVVFPKLGIFVIINQIYWAWQFEKKKKREVLVQPTLGQGLLSWIRNQMTWYSLTDGLFHQMMMAMSAG